ncbi:amino acid deaminase [Kineococcus sp. R8]|uniref:amino acid deaminase n=1 Tax=Kineococcus siccus TaxID=2696567 RepID=UPI00141341DB|nr:amino acid deaminase [Kineococcus siccus]NAZ82671.1 amino acid deaminase [Kineococcus siccus]
MSQRYRYDAAELGVLGAEHKAVPVGARALTGAEFVAGAPRLADLPTPLLTLDAGALAANVATMAAWSRRAGVDLAPHGKTTMAPAVWRQQLAAGAWGITVATPWQLGVALEQGVPVVLAAYPLLEPAVLRLLTARPRAARVLVWADGVDVVAEMARHLPPGAAAPVDVLVELGAAGARTGARTTAAGLEVARAVAGQPGLRLAGVAGYEGALAHDASPSSRDRVRRYLVDLADLHARLLAEELYDDVPGGLVVTAGGSAYFDLVADVLAPLHDPDGARGRPVRTVVRAGASVAHDDGFYRGITPVGRATGGSLRAAVHGWARVVSRPEPGLALADAGKRDLPFDEGFPEVQAVRRRGTGPAEAVRDAVVTALNDQHAFVRLGPGAGDLRVGDVLRLGISHPCTAFDKWGLLPVLDDALADEPVVVDLVRTVFG